jgi:hypothetical protein
MINIMKTRFKYWWSTILPISKLTITSYLKSLNINKPTTYDVWNSGPVLGHALKYGGISLVNENPTPFLIIE